MRVVHLVVSNRGGAAKAAIRLHQALLRSGEQSEVVVLEKKGADNEVSSYFQTKLHMYLWKSLRHILKIFWRTGIVRNRDQYYSFNGIGVSLEKHKSIREADIIHMHWICNGYVTAAEMIRAVNNGKKLVWTLHDMWAFTGGCHYTGGCKKYLTECANCECIKRDQDALRQQLSKRELFTKKNVIVVGCSSWISGCAEKSSVMKGCNISSVHNCIDTTVFRPYEAAEIIKLKKKIGITEKERCLLIGAMNISDTRKGIEFIEKIAALFSEKNYVFLFFGQGEYRINTDVKQVYLGNIASEEKLALLYSMSDVFLAPSKEENLANTVLESISCGTPVAAFNIGGMKEMIKQGENGYLARPFDIKDFCCGIECCIEIKKEHSDTWFNHYAEEKFGFSKISSEYKEVYRKLL